MTERLTEQEIEDALAHLYVLEEAGLTWWSGVVRRSLAEIQESRKKQSQKEDANVKRRGRKRLFLPRELPPSIKWLVSKGYEFDGAKPTESGRWLWKYRSPGTKAWQIAGRGWLEERARQLGWAGEGESA